MKQTFLDRIGSNKLPVLVFDGATGTSLQDLNLEADAFGGEDLEGCNENLVLSSPESVKHVHKIFLEAGCDVIETNTFGASSIVLEEYGIADKAYEINKVASILANEMCNHYSTDIKPRYVAGSIGPTTKLPTLGHITFDEMVKSYEEQVSGLLDGGVDLLLVETCQDVLQIKSALNAIENQFVNKRISVPIMVSITVETTGTMLVGSDISAALTILEPFQIDILGLNCATGPVQMKEHIKYLSENSPFYISCIPNAGLPENVGGKAHYKLTPLELKMQIMHFVQDLGVKVIGGCCGTTPEHIRELSLLSEELYKSDPCPNWFKKNPPASASSIYNSVPYEQDNSFLIIGERLNASGSKKVRDLLNEDDWDGLISIARDQVKENAHILDVNVDYVGRNGESDMNNVVSRLVTNVNLPLMLDSTEYTKMESGLKVAGGKCLLNSTNYEDGNDRFFKVVDLAKRYGAGLVVGTIDESGMARTASQKYEIASRAYKDIVGKGINPSEIFIDPLALPISTGIEDDRRNALETIKAIKKIKNSLPEIHIILGISNISFGLSQAARINLNSVFLNECVEAGLDSAIISPSKILPMSKIDKAHIKIAKDLIFDKRNFKDDICIYDPLTELTSAFEGVKSQDLKSSSEELRNLKIEDRLPKHIIDGEKIGLNDSLKEALDKYKPLEIINTYLLDGMKTVGELFGSGQMQLPFVLQSAETMKAAVGYLEPYMDKVEGEKTSKGIFLIATVKGDVHDIGKNLVDIILTNNGYDVINLGIKQDITAIVEAQEKYNADCIAMSGLLVKSTAFMKSNLESFNEANIRVPVILGGAALTPKFVNRDCNSVYSGQVIYGKDAFTDLKFMDEYVKAKSIDNWDDEEGFIDPSKASFTLNGVPRSSLEDTSISRENKINSDISQEQSSERSHKILPEIKNSPPFLGTKVVKLDCENIDDILFYLDKNALFSGQWQMRRSRNQSTLEYQEFISRKAEPVLIDWLEKIKNDKLLEPAAVYGYFPCARNGNVLEIYDEKDHNLKLGYFNLPRQKSGSRLCISDYFLDKETGKVIDFIPMQAVTMGHKASSFSQSLFNNNQYTDYLYFHGLSVQIAEALAEYIHQCIRKDCNYIDKKGISNQDILLQKYRGCRFSFGYPACPEVSDSAKQLKWLGASRIGISMDESDQLKPEQSTTAIVALHSSAKYFGI